MSIVIAGLFHTCLSMRPRVSDLWYQWGKRTETCSGMSPGVGRTSFHFNYALVRAMWWQMDGFPLVPRLGGFSQPPLQLSVAGDQVLGNGTWLDVTWATSRPGSRKE